MQTLSTHDIFYIVVTFIYLEENKYVHHFRIQNGTFRHSTEHEKWKKVSDTLILGM